MTGSSLKSALASKILKIEEKITQGALAPELNEEREILLDQLLQENAVRYTHGSMRYALSFPVYLHRNGQSSLVNLKNVSIAGLCVEALKGNFKIGDNVLISFPSDEAAYKKINLTCDIKWTKEIMQGQNDIGLMFDLYNPIEHKMLYLENVYYPAYKAYLELQASV